MDSDKKTLIIADTHLKSNDQFGFPIEIDNIIYNSRTLDKLKKIKNIVSNEKPDRIIIAGDFFDSSKISESLRTLTFKLIKFLDIETYIIAGNHDNKNRMIPGSSEAQFYNKLVIVPYATAIKVDNFTLIGYCRDLDEFVDLCDNNKNKILITHRDIPNIPLPYQISFFGHVHKCFSVDNKISIGSLFKDSWAEENEQNRYIVINSNIEYKYFQDIKIKTLDKLEFPSDDEYNAIRFKFEVTASEFSSIDQESIRNMYNKTKVFFDISIKTEEKKENVTDINEIISSFLKDRNLTKEELEFGKRMIEECE